MFKLAPDIIAVRLIGSEGRAVRRLFDFVLITHPTIPRHFCEACNSTAYGVMHRLMENKCCEEGVGRAASRPRVFWSHDFFWHIPVIACELPLASPIQQATTALPPKENPHPLLGDIKYICASRHVGRTF